MSDFKKGFDPIPEGDYLVRMNRQEEATTRNGGKMIKASFQIVKGDYKDRLLFENFLVEHTSKKAVEIGKDRLSNYLKAVGAEGGLDTIDQDLSRLEDYMELPFIAKVVVKEEEQYLDKATGQTKTAKASNKIVTFKAR